MGFFDKLRRKFSTKSSLGAPHNPVTPQVAQPVGTPAPSEGLRTQQQPPAPSTPAPAGHRVGRDALWIPPGQPVTVAGQLISGGMLYVGRGLMSASSATTEPALIDPSLRVDRRRPDWLGHGLDYWPSYGSIPSASRAAYLTWLAGGRSHPDVPIGYVFLFFYGLERLALIDAVKDPSLQEHLPAITAEVRRLLELYGSHYSYASYGGTFLEVLELMESQVGEEVSQGPPPSRTPERWEVPMALRLGLGQFARDGRSVPAEWALSWQWYHPEIYSRTPQTRCGAEFDELFCLRYRQRHGAGLTLRNVRSRIAVQYRPASAGIASLQVEVPDISDVFNGASATRKLADLAAGVTEELDAYSRWVGRNPEGRGTLPAAALLPAELLNGVDGEVAALRTWIDQQLAGRLSQVVDADQILDRWPKTNPAKMTKPEAVSLAALLGRFGIGIEPDVRLGGPVLSEGAVVLFRVGPGAPQTASPAYAAAATLLQMAVAVGAADGVVSKDEHDHLAAHMESALQLTADEKVRLDAHLQWMVATGVKLTGLTKRLAALSTSQRSAIGDFMITVAAADGVVSPDEVKILMKIYKLLGLEQDGVHSRIHQHLADGHTRSKRPTPATGPVTVRPATQGPTGYALPNTPPAFPATVAAPVDPPGQEGLASERLAARSVVLDEAVIAEKLAESAQISAVLAGIFAENDEPATIVASESGQIAIDTAENPTMVKTGDEPVADLDAAHSGLIRALATQPAWSPSEYARLAERFGVMPAGALDVLNTAAIEICGEPFAEGGDDSDKIEINDYARQELFG